MSDKQKHELMTDKSIEEILRDLLEGSPCRKVNIIIANGAHLDGVYITKVGKGWIKVSSGNPAKPVQMIVMIHAISTIVTEGR